MSLRNSRNKRRIQVSRISIRIPATTRYSDIRKKIPNYCKRGILGYVQILKRDSHVSAAQQSKLDIIERSENHLLNLINDILELAKIEARKLELHLAEVSFRMTLSLITYHLSTTNF